jgi:hypothetical protein
MGDGIDWDKLQPEVRERLEALANKMVFARCTTLVLVGDDGEGTKVSRPCGLERKYAGRCSSGHEVGPLSVGLRMPEDYKPHPVSDGGGVARVWKVNVDDADDLLRRFLPDAFVFCYERLVDLSFGERNLGSAGGYDETKVLDEKADKVKAGQARRSAEPVKGAGLGKRGSGRSPIFTESAVNYRSKLDRRLRRMAREIQAFLDGKGARIESRKCAGKCRKIGEAEWVYCPRCGGPMEQVD